jgi:hypothetical protein
MQNQMETILPEIVVTVMLPTAWGGFMETKKCSDEQLGGDTGRSPARDGHRRAPRAPANAPRPRPAPERR